MEGIEFICLGNNARSVMAEMVAKDYVKKIGADIPIFSSGVGVKDALEKGFCSETIAAANRAGLYGTTQRELVEAVWEKEAELRNEALITRGQASIKNHVQRQTEPKENVLMLAVSDSIKNILWNMRQGLPNLYTIEEYTGVKSLRENFDLQVWLTKVGPHLAYLDNLIAAVPKAVDKYIREF